MLNNSKDNIGKLFRDAVEGFDEDLPSRVWDNVNCKLKKDNKRKKTIFYLSVAASIAVIIAFSSGYYMALNNSENIRYSNINNQQNRKSLVYTIKSNTNSKNNNIIVTNTITNKYDITIPIKGLIKHNKHQLNNTLSFQQNKNNSNLDTIKNVNNLFIESNQELIANNNVNDLTVDTVNTKKPIFDIINDYNKDVKNIDILNKKPNIANNITPFEKKQNAGKETNKWSIAEQFSPVCYLGNTTSLSSFGDQTSNYYGFSSTNSTVNEPIKNILFVYATGISFKFQINRKWGVKSGVFYASGELYQKQQYRQIEVPLMATYSLINKKFIWGINGGIGANILFLSSVKNINYSALCATSIGYNISKKVSVNIEPTLKYNFSYPHNYIFHYYPVSFALYTGLSYNF